MAHKKRNPEYYGGNIVIEFEHVDLLRIERLLKILDDTANGVLTSEENEWLSNALDLFAPETSLGEYPV